MCQANSQVFKILLFAVLREKAGSDALEVRLPAEGATVADLLNACGEQHPALAPWLPHIKVAVNCAYATSNEAVRPGDEIAFLPPVAGGAF